MREELKDLLICKRVELVDHILLDEASWNYLIAKRVVTSEQKNKIKLGRTLKEQVAELLDLLPLRDDTAFDTLKDMLKLTNQQHVVTAYLIHTATHERSSVKTKGDGYCSTDEEATHRTPAKVGREYILVKELEKTILVSKEVIVERLEQVDEIVTYLQKEKSLLTRRERDNILGCTLKPYEQVENLLRVVIKKTSPNLYKEFASYLNELDMQDLKSRLWHPYFDFPKTWINSPHLLVQTEGASKDMMFKKMEHLFTQRRFTSSLSLYHCLQFAVGEADDFDRIIANNAGQYDTVILAFLHLLGNLDCRDFLDEYFPYLDAEICRRKVANALDKIIASPRRLLESGEIFLLKAWLYSCQFHMAGTVQDVLHNQLWLEEIDVTSEDCEIIGQFLHHVSKPISLVQTRSDIETGVGQLLQHSKGATALYVKNPDISAVNASLRDMSRDSTMTALYMLRTNVIEANRFQLTPESPLRHLGLRFAELGKTDLKTVYEALSHFQNIESLDLSGNQLGREDEEDDTHFPPIAQLPHLKYIMLSQCNLDEKDVKQLTSVGNNLEYVDVSENPRVGDEGLRHIIEMLGNETKLYTLLMSECGLKSSQSISEFLKRSSVETLCLSRNDFSNTQDECFSSSSLKKISLKYCELKSHQIARLLAQHNCDYVDITWNKVHRGFASLTESLFHSANRLNCLQICGCSLQDMDIDILVEASKGQHFHLKQLDLSLNIDLTGSAIEGACSIQDLSTLCVNECRLQEDEWKQVGMKMNANSSLQTVAVGDKGVKMVKFLSTINRDFDKVLIHVHADDRLIHARCISEKEIQIGKLGMFVIHNTPSIGYRKLFCDNMPNSLPDGLRHVWMWYTLWKCECCD